MPFCQNCGKRLAENEVCNCTATNPNPTPVPKPSPQNTNNNSVNPAPAPKPNNQNVSNGTTPPPAPQPAPQAAYQNVSAQQTKKKTPVGLIIAIILIPIVLIVLLVIGLLAAILVPSMIGYTNKSKVTSANANASSLYKGLNSSLVEMDSAGYKISGSSYYIICSDKKNNYNVPTDNFDEDKFYKTLKNYYSDSEKGEWFAVVEYGSVSYVASSESWKNQLVGTYPKAATPDGPSYYDTYYLSTTKREKASLTKLYNEAAKKVKQKAEDASYYNYY